MEKQCTKCHSKEILIKHPVRKWPNGNPEEFYVCSNKKCSYHRFSISEEELSQAILSAEERAVRDLITSVGYRVETVLGYLEMGKTEEAIKHLENIHELFVTKQK